MDTEFGIEHEFVVRWGGDVVDFRTLLPEVDVDGVALDPVDPHAHRLPSGVLVTCDGAEAEVATPPLPLTPGFTGVAAAWTAEAARSLRAIVPDDHDLEGVSTHISVSVDDELGPRAAGLFARTFAPALMLLLDGPDSPGLLVRPRYGRVELGGEYAVGEPLAAALALAVGGVRVCADVVARRRRKSALPPPLRVEIEPAVLRYGWYVDRAAFGVDLYAADRSTKLRRELVGTITVEEVLRRSWVAARTALADLATPLDLASADDAVAGRRPLPTRAGVDTNLAPSADPPAPHPLGRILARVERPGFTVEPVVAAWDFTVLRVAGDREVYATVPRADTCRFVTALNRGELDESFGVRLARPADGSRLHSYVGATRRGVYDEMVEPRRLAAPERRVDGRLVVEG